MNFRNNKKIVIDAYRGGDDIGNNSNGIIEKDYNLNISKYIYNKLKELNIPVSITRTTDETLDMNNRINKILSFYGDNNDVIVISNALNSNNNGTEIVYALRNSSTLANKIAQELEKIGISNVKFYQRRLPSDTSKDYNQLIRDTNNNESIIIYYGNNKNTEEATFLKNNQELIAEAVITALTDYLNIEYTNDTSNNDYYIVQKGDTLYGIANKFNITVNELKELNNLKTNNLSINQKLKIPTIKNINNEYYIVKKGDTLYKIASNFNITVDELKKLNNLTSNILSIGQRLKIKTNNNNNNYLTYKVVSGDSLYSIAKKYNTTVNNIKELNDLTTNLLSINQILKIPSSSNNYITYKVVSGDSLYSIAKKYNTTVNDIKELNNLTTNLLSINQILKIPPTK